MGYIATAWTSTDTPEEVRKVGRAVGSPGYELSGFSMLG
jgi:hypothetical protein